MLKRIMHYCRNQNVVVSCIGIDLNAHAIAIGKASCIDFPEIQFLQKDILSLTSDEISCDILLCTLTMHHFTDNEIPIFLNQFAKLSTLGVVINDLQRSAFAYYLFKLFSIIFINTKIAKTDGLISISKGFRKQELIAFSKALPEVVHQIRWRWAFRYLWLMQTSIQDTSYE